MAVDITVPSVGESITEGTLSRWLKKDGEFVQADEPLFELETEKATTEIAAPAAGVLRIRAAEGQTVAVGSSVGQVDGAAAPAPAKTAAQPAKDRDEGRKPAAAAGAREGQDKAAAGAGGNSAVHAEEELVTSPSVRRLAEESGLDVRELSGTGKGGRVTKEDVLSHLERKKAAREAPGVPAVRPPAAAEAPKAEPGKQVATAAERPAPTTRETRQRMSAIRQRIADRLVTSKNTAAILTTFNEADMSAAMALRSKYKDGFKEKHKVNLGFMSFFVKASVEALRAFPVVNASIDGTDVVYHHFYDIGVAVSTEKGLMVPVLRNAERLSFAEIEKQIAALAQKARDGKISVNDLQGGTFTITNGGVFGSLVSTPIINPPQSAILGMHTIQKRPVAVNDQVVIRPMMYLALSYDHRLVDGREAVQFLVRVKECIESPERLLLEI